MNFSHLKKLFPLFTLLELILIFHSILIKKFNIRVRIYYELISNLKFIKKLRKQSRKKLYPYQKLDRTLDPVLMGKIKHFKFLNQMFNILNYLLEKF